MPLLTVTSVLILVKDAGVITPASIQIHTLLISSQSCQTTDPSHHLPACDVDTKNTDVGGLTQRAPEGGLPGDQGMITAGLEQTFGADKGTDLKSGEEPDYKGAKLDHRGRGVSGGTGWKFYKVESRCWWRSRPDIKLAH